MMGMKTYLHGPMDYAKTLKLQFRVSSRGPGPAKKDKVLPVVRESTTAVRRRRRKMHRCALVEKQ